jgi:hypothetical protein
MNLRTCLWSPRRAGEGLDGLVLLAGALIAYGILGQPW